MPVSTNMYPDWPESFDDLVPLPQCEGPKLKPFDFQGPQKIKFLEYVGAGLNAHVFKVEILGRIYALKLFRFCNPSEWTAGDFRYFNDEDDVKSKMNTLPEREIKLRTAFAKYSEPFNCECRAYGRLQESDNGSLALQCFGYVLLDEDHERTMLDQFLDKGYSFGETADLRDDFVDDKTNLAYMYDSHRPHFLGKTGRPPPIRGIVKEFGEGGDEDLRPRDVLKLKRDLIALHQLGIMCIDAATQNLRNGKIIDFSQAVTTPHYMINPELNPHLTPEWISAIEFETFQFAVEDFMTIQEMVIEWNEEHELEKDKMSVFIFPQRRYELRKRSDERLYSFVNPRLHDWRTFSTGFRHHQNKQVKRRSPRKADKSGSSGLGEISRTYRRLYTSPPRWYFDSVANPVAKAKRMHTHSDFRSISTTITWELKDGLIFPREKWNG